MINKSIVLKSVLALASIYALPAVAHAQEATGCTDNCQE